MPNRWSALTVRIPWVVQVSIQFTPATRITPQLVSFKNKNKNGVISLSICSHIVATCDSDWCTARGFRHLDLLVLHFFELARHPHCCIPCPPSRDCERNASLSPNMRPVFTASISTRLSFPAELLWFRHACPADTQGQGLTRAWSSRPRRREKKCVTYRA